MAVMEVKGIHSFRNLQNTPELIYIEIMEA